MIDFFTMDNLEALFSHVNSKGINTHIAVERLYKWVLANKSKLEVQLVPINNKLAQSFIRDNVCSFERILELATRQDLEPIIFCKDGNFTNGSPDVFMADGHHRYALGSMMRAQVIPAYLLELEEWMPFKVINAPSVTHQQLQDHPIRKREY